MHIVTVGLNHRVAPVEVRERLAFTSASLTDALARFRPPDGTYPYAPEGAILSTCNRLEVYTLASSSTDGQDAVCSFLEDCHGQSRDDFQDYLYAYADEEAIADSTERTLESVSSDEPKETHLAQRIPQLDQERSKKRNSGQLLVTFCPFLGSLRFFLLNQVAMYSPYIAHGG